MQNMRVLGTIGLITATVLGAVGPVTSSHAARAAKTSGGKRLSLVAQTQKVQQALQQGYVTTKHGNVYFSNALSNRIHGAGGSIAKSSAQFKAAASAKAAAVAPQVGGASRANQDFGFYYTGNGQLFHNTASVAVDPQDAAHVVIAATDTRAGSDGSIFNPSSDPLINVAAGQPDNFNTCFNDTTVVIGTVNPPSRPCALSQALGGPGIYDSVDRGATFTDSLIPDMISGAVPNALNQQVVGSLFAQGTTAAGLPNGIYTIVNGAPTLVTDTGTLAPTETLNDIHAEVTCIQPYGTAGPIGVGGTGVLGTAGAGAPLACQPYDSAGDNTVAFDSFGNLYVASLGLVDNGVANNNFIGIPQTDVVVNVSPAIQPIGLSYRGTGAVSGFLGTYPVTGVPDSAGRFFNSLPQRPALTGAGGTIPACNAEQYNTLLCLHGEVTASTYATNFITDANFSSLPATLIGRNYQADGRVLNNPAVDQGPGECGFVDVCLIDQPYLSINTQVDAVAYLTYTLIDFGSPDGPTSNVYVQTATLPSTVSVPQVDLHRALTTGAAATLLGGNNTAVTYTTNNDSADAGVLPFWSLPALVDDSVNNPYSDGQTLGDSWGAQTAIGPDGSAYIAYENADSSVIPTGGLPYRAIFVAQLFPGTGTVSRTALAALSVDHDAYNLSQVFGLGNGNITLNQFLLLAADPAGLDPASGAYFTIPSRPSVAVTLPFTGQVTTNGTTVTKYLSGGEVIVAWTDQRGTGGAVLGSGTRIWYAIGASINSQPISFGFTYPSFLTGLATANANVTYSIGLVSDPGLTAGIYQFFPAIATTTFATNGTGTFSGVSPVAYNPNVPSNIFIGFYQYVAGTVNPLSYRVAKSNDGGNTFGVNQVATSMPLPNYPLSSAFCASNFGFTPANGFTTVPLATAACNAAPYFGTSSGASSDLSNGAYFAWTDTRADFKDFNVGGSQNVYSVHVN